MTWKKIFLFLLLASFSFGVGVYIRIHRIDTPPSPRNGGDDDGSKIVSEDTTTREPELQIQGRINLLVLGEDNIESVKRSDTILFVAIDVEERNIRVLSLPRDTRVSIPGHGNQKLNHAYAYGGADLLRATVERFLGTTIHYYVKIDYDSFPKLVDAVGGVDIFVGKAMKYTDRAQGLSINIPAGKQRMNGETALKYVRFRMDALGDIGRVRRQQQFLKAFLHRMYEPENLLNFRTVINEIRDTVSTDMDPSMIVQLSLFVRKLEKEPDRIFFKMLPGTPTLVDGLSYWISDRKHVAPFLTATTEELREMERLAKATPNGGTGISDISSAGDYSADSADGSKRTPPPNAPSSQEVLETVRNIPEAIAVLNGTGKAGVAQKVASHLQKMGIDVTHVGNAKHFDYRSTKVAYPENATQNARKSAELLAKLSGVPASLTTQDRQVSYPSLIVGHDYERLLQRLESSYATIQ